MSVRRTGRGRAGGGVGGWGWIFLTEKKPLRNVPGVLKFVSKMFLGF